MLENNSVPRAIMQYAIPTILSQIVTLIYNLADTFFVGHTNNPAQVAALALSFPLFMSMTLIGNLFGIGANSLMSRSLGHKDPRRAATTSTFAFYGALAMMAVWMIVLSIFMHPVLTVIGAKTAETYQATGAYIRWTVVIGGLPTVASLMLGHLSRGEGNTKRASIGMAFGGLLNIALDPVFVQGFGMGAAGAGIATCISNAAAFIYLFVCVKRDPDSVIRLSPRAFKIISSIASQVILVGMPAAAVIVLGSSANIVLTHFMSAYGDVPVAAFGVVQKIGTITMQITIGLTQGIMPLLGYCYGAGDMKHVKEINRWSFLILAVYAASCVVLIELFPGQLIHLFIHEPETVAIGTAFLKRYILCAFGMCFVMLLNSMFQAMGKWRQSLLLSFIRQGVLLIPLLTILNRVIGMYGLVWSQPVADTCALVLGFVMYGVTIYGKKIQGIFY